MAVSALALLSPLFVILALLVKISSPGHVFYQATRVGRDGKPFRLLKFRSMITNADKIGPQITGAYDPRITPIGHFMRSHKLDELPQLINVLRGEMSLVGPRPEHPRYVAFYSDEQRRILDVRPGITSPASVYYRKEETLLISDDHETYYVQQILPAKLAMDLEYIERMNLIYDLTLIFLTVGSLLH